MNIIIPIKPCGAPDRKVVRTKLKGLSEYTETYMWQSRVECVNVVSIHEFTQCI